MLRRKQWLSQEHEWSCSKQYLKRCSLPQIAHCYCGADLGEGVAKMGKSDASSLFISFKYGFLWLLLMCRSAHTRVLHIIAQVMWSVPSDGLSQAPTIRAPAWEGYGSIKGRPCSNFSSETCFCWKDAGHGTVQARVQEKALKRCSPIINCILFQYVGSTLHGLDETKTN